jgi:uncharacterized protein YneF (UPF0154 family)
MKYFDKLKAKLDTLDEKQLYTYVLGLLGTLLLLTLLVMFYYYRSARSIKRQLKDLNTIRSTQVRQILTKAERLQKQKEKLDALLAEKPDFKLTEYLEEVLSKLNLSERKDISQAPRTVELDDKYTENILEFTMNDINMKQLVDFLASIEENRRVYTKKLEITKSKTTPNSLEVHITIATLFPKAA